MSLWVCVNANNNVVNANGVEIFGDSGGKLSAILTGTANLQLQWLSESGTTNGSSSYGMTLVPGWNYHLATTWQNGKQNYYVNGVPGPFRYPGRGDRRGWRQLASPLSDRVRLARHRRHS